MFNSRPFVGRGKLDTAGVTIGCPDNALVTRVASMTTVTTHVS